MSLFGGGSMWDSGASDMFFTQSGVSKVLERDEFTLEDLLMENEIIQDTQAQSGPLMEYLCRPATVDSLLSYLSVPRDVADEDAAYRFPYMVTELLSLSVPRLLDAACPHLSTLFAFLLPPLQLPTCRSAVTSPLRPYMAGYFAKVVALLCKKRPARLATFLDRTPGLAAALTQPAMLSNGSMALLLTTLLDLPWHDSMGMGRLRLARRDDATLPALLMSVFTAGLRPPVQDAHMYASASAHAADVLQTACSTACSSAPHAKFAVEGYNAALLRGGDAASLLHGGDDEEAAATSTTVSGAIIDVNMQMDASYHSPSVQPTDRVHVRLMKAFRDGPAGAELVEACVAGVTSGTTDMSTSAQNALEAPLRALAAVLDTAACSYVQQRVMGFGYDSIGPMHPHARAPSSRGDAARLGACPRVLLHIIPHVPTLATHLTAAAASAVAASGAATHDGDAAPSYSHAPRLGQASLALIKALCALLRCGWPEVHVALDAARVPAVLLDCVQAYPWHSIMHRHVADALLHVLTHDVDVDGLVTDAQLHARIMAAFVANDVRARALYRCMKEACTHCRVVQQPPITALSTTATPGVAAGARARRRTRVGYMGHYTALANALLLRDANGTLGPSAAAQLRSSGWDAFTMSALAVANIAHGILIGGMAPDVKKSGNVGASADATARTAVDEVQAMENKETGDADAAHQREEDEEEEREHAERMRAAQEAEEDARETEEAPAGAQALRDEDEDDEEAEHHHASPVAAAEEAHQDFDADFGSHTPAVTASSVQSHEAHDLASFDFDSVDPFATAAPAVVAASVATSSAAVAVINEAAFGVGSATADDDSWAAGPVVTHPNASPAEMAQWDAALSGTATGAAQPAGVQPAHVHDDHDGVASMFAHADASVGAGDALEPAPSSRVVAKSAPPNPSCTADNDFPSPDVQVAHAEASPRHDAAFASAAVQVNGDVDPFGASAFDGHDVIGFAYATPAVPPADAIGAGAWGVGDAAFDAFDAPQGATAHAGAAGEWGTFDDSAAVHSTTAGTAPSASAPAAAPVPAFDDFEF